MSWIVLRKDWIALLWSRSRSQERLRIPVNVQLHDISSTAEAFVTRLGMVMHHHGPKCHARKQISCLQVQGHSEDSNDQIYDCFWHIYWTADLLHPNLVGWHIIISLRGMLFCCRCYVCVCECVEMRLLFSRSRSQGRIKTLLNLYVFYMFCTTDLLATKLAVLM